MSVGQGENISTRVVTGPPLNNPISVDGDAIFPGTQRVLQHKVPVLMSGGFDGDLVSCPLRPRLQLKRWCDSAGLPWDRVQYIYIYIYQNLHFDSLGNGNFFSSTHGG